MKRSLIILAFIALAGLGGKMLTIDTKTSSTPQTRSLASSLGGMEGNLTSRNPDNGLSPVVRIVDGDTIVAEINGIQEKIRLIGVDTPEVVDPRKPVQCFGKEASAFTKNLLVSKRVRLESDPSQGNRDKYNRLLRYVFLPDGTLVNRTIIAEGYGHEYTYRTPYRYRDNFKASEYHARTEEKGLWLPSACKP